MFKTELHVHTRPISRCAKVEAAEATRHFEESGYNTIVITNHMSPRLFGDKLPCDPNDWKAVAKYFLSDYYIAKETAKKMNVLLGMELRVTENMNDYLVYGIDEQFIFDMGNILDKNIKDVVPMIHEAGGIILQAHPFRNNMTITKPELLDGIEIINFTAKHDSRNDIATLWAKKYDMLGICGQDYHNTEYLVGAGILTDCEITNEKQLRDILVSRDFKMTDGREILTY